MDSFADKLSEKRLELEAEYRAIRCRVAILGAGESHWSYEKRTQIYETLSELGYQVFFPESFVEESQPTTVGVSVEDQERLMLTLPDVRLIIVLDTSEGPLSELSAFSHDTDIVTKTLVLCPWDYYSPGDTFTADILEQYPNVWRYTQEEFDKCKIIRKCVANARTARSALVSVLHSKQF